MHPLHYFNDAATAWPKVPGVTETVDAALEELPTTPGRGGAAWAPDTCPLGQIVGECRRQLGRLLGAEHQSCVAFTMNATHALNLAIWGVGLLPSEKREPSIDKIGAKEDGLSRLFLRDTACRVSTPFRVIISVAEHNSVLRPLRHLAKWRELEIVTIGLYENGALNGKAFGRALAQGADLVILTHASNVTGHIYDVASFFAKAHVAGAYTLLDASQSIGHLPVRPIALNADMVAFPGHKGLRGPQGTGGLYVRPGLELEPVFVGGTGSLSEEVYQPEVMPMRLEAGTPNTPAIAGLSAALRWHEQHGEAFRHTERVRAAQLRAGLREIPGLTIFDDHPEADYLPVVSFRLDGLSVEETGRRLGDEFNILCRTGLHCAPLIHEAIGSAPEGTVRFSISGFTTEDEIDYALNAVHQLAPQRIAMTV